MVHIHLRFSALAVDSDSFRFPAAQTESNAEHLKLLQARSNLKPPALWVLRTCRLGDGCCFHVVTSVNADPRTNAVYVMRIMKHFFRLVSHSKSERGRELWHMRVERFGIRFSAFCKLQAQGGVVI